jgi:hypothetical protein
MHAGISERISKLKNDMIKEFRNDSAGIKMGTGELQVPIDI